MTADRAAENRCLLPLGERVAKALERAGFDESDTTNAVDALGPFIRDYDRIDAQRADAVGAITNAVMLIRAFDPTCGSGRTRTFLGDLESLLRGHSPTAPNGDSETDRREPSVEVPLEALCVIIETAQRLGIYQGTAVFDAYMQMPTEVNRRLIERANVHTENLLRGARAVTAHREGKPHDESMCVECAIGKAESNG